MATIKLTLGWLDGLRDGVGLGEGLGAELGREVSFIEGNPVGSTSSLLGVHGGLGHIGSVVWLHCPSPMQ